MPKFALLLLPILLLLMAVSAVLPPPLLAATGDLQVTCESGVKIYVDGKLMGETNDGDRGLFVEGLSVGSHRVKAVKPGSYPVEKTVEIHANQAAAQPFRFKVMAEKVERLQSEDEAQTVAKVGAFEFRSAPMGAKVYLDGTGKGDTDFRISNITIGRHKVRFELGGQVLEGTFNLGEGETLKLKAHFKKKEIINLSAIEAVEEAARRQAEAEEEARRQAAAEEARREAEEQRRMAEEARRKLLSLAGEFVSVPGGCYTMGDFSRDDRWAEKQQVCVDGFLIGKYEVTQGQWKALMGNNPAKFQKGDNYPVEGISWNDAQVFISRLNLQTGKDFRLPTEAEWEYACRSGGRLEKHCGGNDVDSVAWHAQNSGNSTHPVGQKAPNGLGIYDMSGNVDELCQDWYSSYQAGIIRNPIGPDKRDGGHNSGRVFRGDSFGQGAYNVLSFTRHDIDPDGRWRWDLGFRLVLPGNR